MADHKNLEQTVDSPSEALAGESVGPGTGSEPWPDGWYVYESNGVVGPFSAKDVFARTPNLPNGEPRLVSRKGFSQWYPLADLADIYRFTDNVTKRRLKEVEDTKQALMKTMSATRELEQPKVKSKQVGPQAPDRNAVATAREKLADDKVMAQPAKPKNVAKPAAKAPVPPPTTIQPSAMPASVVSGPITKTPDHDYFVLRGRLRLGKIRNPWLVGFFGIPFSLGAYWVVWLAELSRETNWHRSRSQQMGLGSMVLAMIPGLHCYVAYELATKIAAMEMENKYKTVSPGMAALLALFPPAVVVYLQRAVNQHWMLHVASARRSADKPAPQPAKQPPKQQASSPLHMQRPKAGQATTHAQVPPPRGPAPEDTSPLQMAKKKSRRGSGQRPGAR